MSATAALFAAIVAEFAAQGSEKFVALTVALAITTGIAALVAGLARDVGQVRDVLEAADEGPPSIPTYRSVREAVEAVGHPSGVMRRHPAST